MSGIPGWETSLEIPVLLTDVKK